MADRYRILHYEVLNKSKEDMKEALKDMQNDINARAYGGYRVINIFDYVDEFIVFMEHQDGKL